MIRRAAIRDVPVIGRIINDAAEQGLMLHRSFEFLYENVRDFHVAVADDHVVGVCGLKVVWANLAEVYALAVRLEHRGRGIGRRLVLSCLDEAEELGVRRIMVLTYEQPFFEKLGFEVVDREQLPLKVWSECVRCAKNQACDEIAMVRELADVPVLDAPQPGRLPSSAYVVPTPVQLDVAAQRRKMDEAH